VFLAILELVRHHSVRTEQHELHGEIWIVPGEQFNTSPDWSDVDEYGGGREEGGEV
jgi:segregation and condensation protein A